MDLTCSLQKKILAYIWHIICLACCSLVSLSAVTFIYSENVFDKSLYQLVQDREVFYFYMELIVEYLFYFSFCMFDNISWAGRGGSSL